MVKKGNEKKRLQKKLSDLVGVDFSSTATKVVRLKQSKGELSLVGIDLLPATKISEAVRLELPKNLISNYGCLTYSASSAVVRVVNSSLEENQKTLPESRLRQLLNVGDGFRVSARLMKRGSGKQDSSLLAAAIPQADVASLLEMFPAGPPAPASLEVSGLSFITAFLHACGDECQHETVCLIEAGETVSYFVFLNNGIVFLVGKMGIGARSLRDKIATDLGVDDDLAATILNDRSINISASFSAVMDPFFKQLSISKDFIERHQGTRVNKVYVSGGLSLQPNWRSGVSQMLNAQVLPWNPLKNIGYDSELVSEDLEKQITRFSAAIGAAIGGFEEA